jgi:hypothetical protein
LLIRSWKIVKSSRSSAALLLSMILLELAPGFVLLALGEPRGPILGSFRPSLGPLQRVPTLSLELNFFRTASNQLALVQFPSFLQPVLSLRFAFVPSLFSLDPILFGAAQDRSGGGRFTGIDGTAA